MDKVCLINLLLSVDYTELGELELCDQDCEEECVCKMCVCCSVCSAQCQCIANRMDMNEKMASILKLGDVNYRYHTINK